MSKAIFPGTFDPPTLGHANIIERALAVFNTLIVAVGHNPQKKTPVFSIEERVALLKQITQPMLSVTVVSFEGLLVDFAKQQGISTIVRAVRNVHDLEYEMLQAHVNRTLGNLETLYMLADEKYRFISSSLIHEVGHAGKPLKAFVPKEIEATIIQKLHS